MVTLRNEGNSFSAIARQLGMKRSKDAYRSFHRGLGARNDTERGDLATAELARLVTLEARIRSRDASDPTKMDRRLVALEQMREDLRPHLGSRPRSE